MNQVRLASLPGQLMDQAKRGRELAFGVDSSPIIEAIDYVNSQKLLDTARHVLSGGRALIEFIDLNRDVARDVGIETIAVELSSMVDSGRLEAVKDTLEESLISENPSKVSMEGMTYLRRAERLLSEATRALNGSTSRLTLPSYSLGFSRPSMGDSGSLNVVILGVVALGALTLLAIVLSRK